MRIVIIGGGSYNWTPNLVRDFAMIPELNGAEVVLHDINLEAMEQMAALGRKIIGDAGNTIRLTTASELDDALEGANFVVLTITTGGLEAMRYDLEIPLRYGIYHSVGDTVGPGGLSRAMRNIPVVVDIAKRMAAICPNAWLLNYSNPMATLCRAVTKATKIRTIGLCHEPGGTLGVLREIFGVQDESEIKATVGGINHFSWIWELKVRGEDGFPLLEAWINGRLRFDGGPTPERCNVLLRENQLKFAIFRHFRALPAAGDRHVAEFFPYFLTEATEAGKKYGVTLTTIEDRKRRRLRDQERALRRLRGEEEIPLNVPRGGAAQIIEAVISGREKIRFMNVPNVGQISNLPRDVVVETLGAVNAMGAIPFAVGEMPRGILGLVHRHVINQEMIVDAALTQDRGLALQALLNDPLVKDFDTAKRMLDEMLDANEQFLKRGDRQ